MAMEEAHRVLAHTQPGTFLIRDSGQPDVFFTLSYRGDDAPTSVRVLLTSQRFSLDGSHKNFESLFALLHSYIHSSHKLRLPYRKQRPESLQDMCRRAFIRTHGAQSIRTTPGLSTAVIAFLHLYPCCT
ncbi:suppressor of cytokine signaling 1-like [Aplochiton taeniatus]